jgi:hypothetical protein
LDLPTPNRLNETDSSKLEIKLENTQANNKRDQEQQELDKTNSNTNRISHELDKENGVVFRSGEEVAQEETENSNQL